MAEYIEREALKRDLIDNRGFYPSIVKAAIENAPTADVVKVVHGEWMIKSEIDEMFGDVDEEFYIECPFCKRTFYVPFELEEEKIIEYAKERYPYCNCGAKMDGKDGKI